MALKAPVEKGLSSPGWAESIRESLSDLASARLAILGGTGFVGTAILRAMEASGAKEGPMEILCLSREAPTMPLDVMFPTLPVVWQRCDVKATFAPRGPVDFLIHAAVTSSAGEQNRNPSELMRVITEGMRNVIRWSEGQVASPRVLHTSSGAVYGHQPEDLDLVPEEWPGLSEESPPTDPYRDAKRIAEKMFSSAAAGGSLIGVNARLFSFVGPSMPRKSHFAMSRFIEDAVQGRSVTIDGTGGVVRSYLDEADMAAWLLASLVRGDSGRSYNVGSSKAMTLAEVATVVAARGGTEVRILGNESADGPRLRYVPDSSRITKELGLSEWSNLYGSVDDCLVARRSLDR